MSIEAIVKTYPYEDGEIQRVQMVKTSSFDSLDFFSSTFSTEAFNGVIDVIEKFQVSKYPMLFGTIVFFHIPEGVEVPYPSESAKYGKVYEKNIRASILFRERFKNGKFVFKTSSEEQFAEALKKAGTLRILRGKRSDISALPFSDHFGRMSEVETTAAFKVNSNFFVMDSFDCSTVYDTVGTPLGLCVKNGKVINPPLFEREAILAKKDGVSVSIPRLSDCRFVINGLEFIPGKNCRIIERPARRITKSFAGTDLVIVGTKVVAVKDGGKTPVPGGGFILQVFDRVSGAIAPGSEVEIHGFEDVSFGIQVGNSIVKEGVPTGVFVSKFFSIKKLFSIPYPPCFYPLDYENSRAARIAFGEAFDGSPCFLWAEGAAKIAHKKGIDSRGASLSDMEHFCLDFGIKNAINLDGGGSSQILLDNKRTLFLSDRHTDGVENERGIPMGIILK